MRPSPIHKLHLKSYPSPKLQNRSLTAGRRGYLASEPENAKGEADFVALVFRRGWIFEILGIMIAGMGLYKTGFLSARLPSRVYLRTAIIGYVISATLVLGGLYQSRRFGFS